MKNRRLKQEIYNISVSATFVVITVIFSRLSFYLPIGGLPASRIGLSAIPIVIASFLLGPVYGTIVGALGDLIGALLFPFGAYFFGFTLDSALLGLIPGLIMILSRKFKWTNCIVFILLITAFYAMIFSTLWTLSEVTISGNIIKLSLTIKILYTIGFTIVLIAAFLLSFFFLRKEKRGKYLFTTFNCILANELLISGMLAGVWKTMLYKLPYPVNIAISLILLIINLPLKFILISVTYPLIVRVNNTVLSSLSLDALRKDQLH